MAPVVTPPPAATNLVDGILGLALATFLIFAYAISARKSWNGTGHLDAAEAPLWWFLSEGWWRGLKRSYVAFLPFGILLVVGGATDAFLEDGTTGSTVALIVAGIGLVGLFAVQIPIILYNRPKALVPPHLRGELGTRQERRRHRSARR